MIDDNYIKSNLDRINWDFDGSFTLPSSVHSLHWYPGNVLPQIPSYLISLLSKKGDLVFDPFCGSGTVGVEALQLGRKSWQSDVCRAAIQVTRGKVACIFNPSAVDQLEEIYDKLFFNISCFTEKCGQKGEGGHEDLSLWLNENTHSQLKYIWSIIENYNNINIRCILEMLFSDILFACSSTMASQTSTGKKRRHHWGWVADNVRPKQPVYHNAIKLFRETLLQAIKVLNLLKFQGKENFLKQENYSIVRLEDARKPSIKKELAHLVVTSPPYLGMTDYTLANRLTYLWMDWPIAKDFEAEIGSRRKRNRKNAEMEYIHQIDYAWKHINRSLKTGGICAILLGASRKFPNFVDRIIYEVSRNGFQLIWGPTLRTPSRRRISDRLGTKSQEFICVWRKSM